MKLEGGSDVNTEEHGRQDALEAALELELNQELEGTFKNKNTKDIVDFVVDELTGKLMNLVAKRKDVDPEKIKKLLDQYRDYSDTTIDLKNLAGRLADTINQRKGGLQPREEPVPHAPTVEEHSGATSEDLHTLFEEQGIRPGAIFYTHEGMPVLIKKVDPENNSIGFIDSKNVYYECQTGGQLETILDGDHKKSDTVIYLARGKSVFSLSTEKPDVQKHEEIDLDLGPKENPITVAIGETLTDTKNNTWKVIEISEVRSNAILELEGKNKVVRMAVVTDWSRSQNKETFKILGGDLQLSRESTLSSPEQHQETTSYSSRELTLESEGQGSFTLHVGNKYRDDNGAIWVLGKITIDNDSKATLSIMNEAGEIKKILVASWSAYPEGVVVFDADTEYFFNPILSAEQAADPEEAASELFDDTEHLASLSDQELEEKIKRYDILLARLNMLK